MISSYLLVCIVVSVVHLCIGTSVFIKAPRERTNQTFYLGIVSMVAWMLLTTTSSLPWAQLEIRATLTRFAYASGMFTAASIAAFCVVFSNRGKIPRREFAVVAIVCAVFIVLSFVPGAILKEFMRSGARVSEISGPFRIPHYVVAAVVLLFGFTHIWRRYRKAEFAEEKFGLRLLGVGFFIPAVTSILSLTVLPVFVETSPLQASIGPISTVVFIVLAGYATLKQGHFIEADLALGHVFESILAGVCVTQVDGRIIRHNHRLVEMLGYEGKLTGRSLGYLTDFLEPDMVEKASVLREWFENERSDPIEITLCGLRNRTLEISAGPLRGPRGKTVGRVILFSDVTERKLLKEDLRNSEEQYRTLVESADDLIYTLDLEGYFTFSNNRASERITGYKVEEWLGRNFKELIVPGEEEHILAHARKAYGGTPQRYEAKIYHKSGKTLTLWNCITPLVKDGVVVGFSVVARDITETKELERQLKESEEQYRALVEESENIVYIVQDGRLKFVNSYGVEISDHREEDLFGADFDPLGLIHPDDRASVDEAFAVLSEGRGKHMRLEARFISKSGKTYDCVMTGTSLTYMGEPAVMGVMMDVTEKKKLQEQLVQSEKLASIGQLVSGVAHELNNPLAGIMGYSQLFYESEEISPKAREAAKKIFESSKRCKKIIQNMLSFARKQEFEKMSLDVNGILDKAVELREYDLQSHRIEVRREYASGLSPVAADPHHMQSVFMNLINNASDAMYEANGRGILRIATRMEGESIVVEFIDDGPGVPSEFRDKVFDPFFTTREVGQGTGLGLSISYGIIKEHGGELILETSHGGGGKFTVRLPAAGAPREKPGAVGPAPEVAIRRGMPRILVVDDEETILDLSVDILESRGYEVDTASTGEIAREKIASNSYDLVIADIRMPGMLSGIDLFHWAKRHMPGLEEKIVFATGDIAADDTQKFLSETKRPCLSKPFEMSEYLDTVRTAIAMSQSVN